MFSLFKSIKLPPPPEEMEKTHLIPFHLSIDSEIISGAYEPRFGLTALGTANGCLYVINRDDEVFRSPKSVDYPLLKIISLPNSSSFFSICSKTMFQRHISRFEKPNPHNLTMLNDLRPTKINNVCTQWIIKPDKILSRTISIDFDIVDVAVSPVHPEFALMLTSEGSLYGFSIESLNFTNLYVNIFEGKPVKSICWSSGYKFLVGHETVDGLDVQSLELVSQYNVKTDTLDSIDQWTATLDNGVPHLLMYMSSVSSVEVPKGSRGVFCGLINGPNWFSVVRSRRGDIVYENRKEKIDLNGDFFVQSILIDYERPFARAAPRQIAVATNTGMFAYFDGRKKNHFIFDPVDVKFTLNDGPDLVFAFAVANIERKTKLNAEDELKEKNLSPEIVDFEVFEFRKGSFVREFKLTSLQVSDMPLGIHKEKIVFIENRGDIRVFDIQSETKTELQKVSPIETIRHSRSGTVDIICEDDSAFRIEADDDDENGFKLIPLEQKRPDKELIDWRPFRDSYVGINKNRELVFNDRKKKIVECASEQILLFDVVNYVGLEPKEDEEEYVVIVTSDIVAVLEYDTKEKKLRKVRKLKQSHINDATITDRGTLIILDDNQLLMLPLPDVSSGAIDKFQISKNGKAALIKKLGAVVFEPNDVTFYIDGFKRPPIYDSKIPPIQQPKVNKFLKLFGKKDDTMRDADRAFQYRRTNNMREVMNETQEITQQLLVKANERGELLNEMEIKSQRILSSARRFHQLARELKNKNWFF